MTLEFEKLTADLEKMAQTTAHRLSQRRERVAEALEFDQGELALV